MVGAIQRRPRPLEARAAGDRQICRPGDAQRPGEEGRTGNGRTGRSHRRTTETAAATSMLPNSAPTWKTRALPPKQIMETIRKLQKMIDDRKWRFIGDISASGSVGVFGKSAPRGLECPDLQPLSEGGQAVHPLAGPRPPDAASIRSCIFHGLMCKPTAATTGGRFRTRNSCGLIEAARTSKRTIEGISGPDRAMMYILASWTGFRKGEIGSLTLRSLRLDDDPPTATVAACYSKRRREDTQVLHPELVPLLKEWLATKKRLKPDTDFVPRFRPGARLHRSQNAQDDRRRLDGRPGQVDRRRKRRREKGGADAERLFMLLRPRRAVRRFPQHAASFHHQSRTGGDSAENGPGLGSA